MGIYNTRERVMARRVSVSRKALRLSVYNLPIVG